MSKVGKTENTDLIKNMLAFSGRNWRQFNDDNPNMFQSDRAENLYIYPDKVKYYEDLRCHIAEEHDVPKTIEDLIKIIKQ